MIDVCRSCEVKKYIRSKGLCPTCYYDQVLRPGRGEWPPTGLGFGNHKRKLPQPTDAIPGSEEKIRVLCERAKREEELWHPDDLTLAAVDAGC